MKSFRAARRTKNGQQGNRPLLAEGCVLSGEKSRVSSLSAVLSHERVHTPLSIVLLLVRCFRLPNLRHSDGKLKDGFAYKGHAGQGTLCFQQMGNSPVPLPRDCRIRRKCLGFVHPKRDLSIKFSFADFRRVLTGKLRKSNCGYLGKGFSRIPFISEKKI